VRLLGLLREPRPQVHYKSQPNAKTLSIIQKERCDWTEAGYRPVSATCGNREILVYDSDVHVPSRPARSSGELDRAAAATDDDVACDTLNRFRPTTTTINCRKRTRATCCLARVVQYMEVHIRFPSPTLSFIPDLKPSFSANPSHCSLSFSSSGLTT